MSASEKEREKEYARQRINVAVRSLWLALCALADQSGGVESDENADLLVAVTKHSAIQKHLRY